MTDLSATASLSSATSVWDASHKYSVNFWGLYGHAQTASVSWDAQHDAWHVSGVIATPSSETISLSGTAPSKGYSVKKDPHDYPFAGETYWDIDAYLAAGQSYDFYYKDGGKVTEAKIATAQAPKGYYAYSDLEELAQKDANSLLFHYDEIKSWALRENFDVKKGLTEGAIQAWMSAHSTYGALKEAIANIAELFTTHLSSGYNLYILIAGASGVLSKVELLGFVHPENSAGAARDRKLPLSLAQGKYGWSVPTSYKALYDFADVYQLLLRERYQVVSGGKYIASDQSADITDAGRVLTGFLSIYDQGGALAGSVQEKAYLDDITHLLDYKYSNSQQQQKNNAWITKVVHAVKAAGVAVSGSPGKRHLLVDEDIHPNGIYNQQDFNAALDQVMREKGQGPLFNFETEANNYITQFYAQHGRLPNAEELRLWKHKALSDLHDSLFSHVPSSPSSDSSDDIMDAKYIFEAIFGNSDINHLNDETFQAIEAFARELYGFVVAQHDDADPSLHFSINDSVIINLINAFDNEPPHFRRPGLTGTLVVRYLLNRFFGADLHVLANGNTFAGPPFQAMPAINAFEEFRHAIGDIELPNGTTIDDQGVTANILMHFWSAGQGSSGSNGEL